MTDLVVHIGLHKAGSSTIQENLLYKIPEYLGKRKATVKDEDLAKQFGYIAIPEDFSLSEPVLRSWVERTMDYKNRFCPDASRLILSEEALSRITPYRFSLARLPLGATNRKASESEDISRRPIAPFLRQFKERIWRFGNVKALVVLRNQPEWLCSLYRQKSIQFKGACQHDFETRVEKLIEHGEDYIDWSRWIEELHQALGEENVCTLLMEDMGREIFWEQLASFTEIDVLDPRDFIKDNVPKYNLGRSNRTFYS